MKRIEKEINIVNFIPVGHENAISRKELCSKTGLTDRKLREEISKARETTCICNMSDGAGYYIPREVQEIDHFIRQESARARSIFKALRGARTLKNLMTKEGC
ncbi:MAG: hypothetical protein ACLRZ9_06025 [Eubacterium sp.]